MILAAGLGTRLGALTSNRPKALVPIGNRPVINRVIQYLKDHHFSEVVVNAHHHHRQLVKHLDEGRPFEMDIQVRVEPHILGTGGGIKNVADFWDYEPFLVINADILTDIDLTKAYRAHQNNKGLATLVLHDYEPFNQIQIDDQLNILDIKGRGRPGRLAFTGIHIIEPGLLNYIPDRVFSNIIDCYRKLIKLGKPIKAYISTGHDWRDIGTIEGYIQANKKTLGDHAFLLGPGHKVHPSARLEDWAIIGEGTRIEKGAEVKRSILWDRVRIKKRTKVIDSIVTSSRVVGHDLVDKVF